MILGVAAVFLVVAISSLFSLESQSKPTCQKGNPDGCCPVNVTSVRSLDSRGYYEKLSIWVWLKADDLEKSPRIEIIGERLFKVTTCFLTKKTKKGLKTSVQCLPGDPELKKTKIQFNQWELVRHVKARAARTINVSFITASTRCDVLYTVTDPVPAFSLEVNPVAKSFRVTLDVAEYPVYVKWCYKGPVCIGSNSSKMHSQSEVHNFPFLLPCFCVEVYYNYTDARRHRKCPLHSFVDATDAWLSSTVTPYQASVNWNLKCAASLFNVSASLCWKQHHHLCTSTLETSLEVEKEEQSLTFSTSELDKHPLMCVQFSLQGSPYVNCPFQADTPSWEVYLGPVGQSVFLYLSSSTPATFSAQLCVLEDRTCTPVGEIHSVAMIEKTTDRQMKVPVYVVAQKPCVQVWRSSPPLIGRRILCPDYAHKRHGLHTVATLMLLFITASVVTFLHRLTKRETTGWLCIQKPALLVCSSDQSVHLSAVCALASILQGELSATVHMALWSLRSQSQDGCQAGVADLGPLPWLYGQWEAVSKEQGKVLIVWSSEAKKTYERWKEGRENVKKTEKRHGNSSETKVKRKENMAEDAKLQGKRQKDFVQSCEDLQREPSSVIAPVFMASLACLEAALHKRKGQRVAFVYFQSFCHNKDIPKAFRGIPRYCLPQDFRGLLQELGAKPRAVKSGTLSCHCLPRLLSKIMSVWLARRLAQKLQTLLPPRQGKNKPRVTSSQKQTLGKAQNGLKLPPTEDTGDTGTSQEHEPGRRSPSRAEEISSLVSRV